MKSLTWREVSAWRLVQSGLEPRGNHGTIVGTAECIGGIQAQVMSAAEMALWARLEGVTPEQVRSCLWKERSLVKTWAMRATLHLISATELPLYVAARSVDEPIDWTKYFDYYGVSEPVLRKYLEVAPDILSDTPMTREAFSAELAKRLKSRELQNVVMAKGWGTPLKPLAWRGHLCFGPSDGRNVTFVNPRTWCGGWKTVEPLRALQEVVRRYLRVYGPATVKDFARWWGMKLRPARKTFESMQDELVPVAVEGWPALALHDTVEAMETIEPRGTVNLVPLFDAYIVGMGRGPEIGALVPHEIRDRVFRPQGWISAVVLVNGTVKGTWELRKANRKSAFTVDLFSPVQANIRKEIEAEAVRLGSFLSTEVEVVYNLA